MNIREVEALLIELVSTHEWPAGQSLRLYEAIRWCKAQQRATLKRKALFKHRADEQRELLR